jgi:hypothetical protein
MPRTTKNKRTAKSATTLPRFATHKYVKPLVFGAIFAAVGVAFLIITNAAPANGLLKNRASGKCIDNTDHQQVNQNVVAIRACDQASLSQQWRFVADGTIRTKDNYCLDVRGGATANQSHVWLYQCSGGNNPAQKWKIQRGGAIKNPRSDRCLAVVDNATADGSQLWIVNCRNVAAQKWDITETAPLASTPTPGSAQLKPGMAWQWQLTGTVDETVLDSVNGPKMYDIDMFSATSALISRLKAKGIYVVCYVESGDWAKGRPDAGDYAPAILGRAIGGFPDEKFVNVKALDGPAGPTGKTLRQIMSARLDLAKSKGCDGIEPDLDDLHTYNTGFSISMDQMVAYNKAVIDMGHVRGMTVGLKNGASGGTFEKKMLAAGADWALNEECNQYDECGGYKAFIDAGKPVFQVEYLDNQRVRYGGTTGTCAKNNAANFDGIVKDSSSKLSALPRIACR